MRAAPREEKSLGEQRRGRRAARAAVRARRAACAADGRGGDQGLSGPGPRGHGPAAAAPRPQGGPGPGALHPQHARLGAGGLLPEDGLSERLRLDAIR